VSDLSRNGFAPGDVLTSNMPPRRTRAALFALVVLALQPVTSLARDEPAANAQARSVRAVRLTDPINIDGRLDDVAWQRAEVAGDFVQRDPDEGKPGSERTELRVAYDDDAIYVGVRLFDREPRRIVKRLSRRDDVSDSDSFTLYLDPHHDHLTGAIFTVSAAGVQADATLYNDSWNDSSWDAVWVSAVSIDEQGWSAELRIPLSELRFTREADLTWGINAARVVARRNETSWLQMVPKKESGIASRMAHLVGLLGIRPRRHLALLPYAVARQEWVAPPAPGDPFNDGSRAFGGLGLDAKLGVTSNLTLDATVNPDFGQVEVDPAVVNLTEFETFYDEKRPFFIEGAQIFSNFGRNGANNFWGFNRSEPDIFYSRRIGRSPQGSADGEAVDTPTATTIFGAAKLTGKTASGWSLGLLEAVTAREQARVFDGSTTGRADVEPLTNYLVARGHRDLGRGGVGLLATSVLRDLNDPSLAALIPGRASVAGVDGYLFLDSKKEWVLTGRVAGSRIVGSQESMLSIQQAPQRYFQRPDSRVDRLDPLATSLSGWTGSLNLNRNSGNLQVNAALWATSPGFESNDIGFNSRSDRWGGHVVGTWRKTKPDRLTRRRQLSIAKWYALNFDGDRQGDGLHVFGNAQLRNFWTVGVNGFKRWRAYNDGLTRGGPSALAGAALGVGAFVETDDRKAVTGAVEAFSTSNEYGSRSLETYLRLTLKPSSGLSLSLGPSLLKNRTIAQWVGAVADPLATATCGSRYVFGEMDQTEWAMSVRLNWILSPRLSFQLYAQPLVSAGDYENFKEFLRPKSFDFARYGVDAGSISYDAATSTYTATPGGGAPSFTFANPDFNWKSLRVNAVARWEYRPGSTLYLVWAQNRVNAANPGDFDLGRDLGDLMGAPADDVLMLKVSYRFGR
jgi:hypothetical protein